MKEQTLKDVAGAILLFGHFLLLPSVVLLYFMGGFLFEEMTTTVALIVPIVSTHTSLVVRHLLRTKATDRDTSQHVRLPYVLISLFLPLLLICYLASVTLAWAYKFGMGSFEEFKGLLVTGEAIYGVSLTQIVESLYKHR